MTGILMTKLGAKVLLNRAYKSVPDYTIPSQFKIGIGTTNPTADDSDLTNAVPIGNGTTNDDGSNNFTGSSGGSNSTSNTTTYKPGAGLTDNTSQNLIKAGTNVLAIWTRTLVSFPVTTKYTGLWIYIKDSITYAKLKSSGTCLEIKLGSDSSNYYSLTKTAAQLQVGWNWISSGLLSSWTQTGTVSGNIDTFIIEITTNNSGDTFVAGEVLYDLLRQWESVDMIKNFDTNYPSIDENTLKATMRGTVNSTEAVGFNLSEAGTFNTDATPKLTGHDVYTSKSKSSTDEFVYVWTDQITLQ